MTEKRRVDNRGVSFVEVIVSMLILSISVIALIGCFIMSLRVNAKSRQAMSATIVAQNVMECVREYANGKVVETNVGEEMKKLLPAAYQTGFATTGSGFKLNGVSEGANEYDVEVTYNKTAFTAADQSGINDREIPDLTTLDADTTAVVCPAGVVNGALEETARDHFYNAWVTDQWMWNSGTEGYAGPSEAECAAAKADIRNQMTSLMTIDVSGAESSPKVCVKLQYEYAGKTYPAYSYESAAGMKKLENVYVFYDPLKIQKDGGKNRIADRVHIKNTYAGAGIGTGGLAWNLFFAVQEDLAGADNLVGPIFTMDIGYIGNKVALYCSEELTNEELRSVQYDGSISFGCTGLENKETFLMSGSYARMQSVTVKVSRSGSGEVLASMETDIIQ